ncbi:MAG: hypothetical protein JXR46_00130 [Calditrichaceae bacterium]|nr:hypothetical protein [Calditrichaceae bacterium]
MGNEIADQNNVADAVKHLADAASIQIKAANKMWLIIVAISLIALFPPTDTNPPAVNVELPFGLATVSNHQFYPILFGLMSVLMVALTSSFAQALRAHFLTIPAVKNIKSNTIAGIHPQDLFDMFRDVSVNRVAPIAQILRGKYQFSDESENCPQWRRVVTAIYYLILKLIAWGVYWILPAYAYFVAYQKAIETDFSHCVINSAGIISVTALLFVAIIDIGSVFKTFIFLVKNKNT